MRSRSLVVVLLLALTASCNASKPPTEFELQSVEDAVRVAIETQNERDVDTFLEFWTDKGLSEYDVGSRADLQSGKVAGFGRERIIIQRFLNTRIVGDNATTTVDAVRGMHQNAAPVSRVAFGLVEREGVWLIDGFKFIGGAPPSEGTDVIDIEGREYSFRLEKDEVVRRVAFKFVNEGKEPHEITLIKGPDDMTLDRARQDLEDFDGDPEKIPEGYQADHVAFADPGATINATFSRPLPAGAYVLACYIPKGGFDDQGGSDADAESHFELGMAAILGVR
ncbi:MAG: hypothetical protein ACRDKJ_12360 [Actinomycetota bacterium]